MQENRYPPPAFLQIPILAQLKLQRCINCFRILHGRLKALFGGKPKMLGVDEVADITGHEVGGVCPFGLKTPLPVYCDVSLKAFDEVVPAAGSIHSAVRIAPSRMAELVAAEWVDVCEIRSQQ